ncbi:MAG: hypothetical protein R2712_00785 [Vicinamibacterales bacterium]
MQTRVAFVVALMVSGAAWADAQSLADVARAEQARRDEMRQPAKVYTNDTLKPDFSRPSPAPAEPAAGTSTAADAVPAATSDTGTADAAAAPAAPAAPAHDQQYWAGRITEARSQLERSRAFGAALQNRIDMLWTDFVNRDNPVERSGIEEQRVKALAELERVKKDIEDQTKAISTIEDEARREGVPAGWLRPS